MPITFRSLFAASKLRTAVELMFICLALATAALATPVGALNLSNCAGGGVSIGATVIDWALPVGPPNGCMVTGVGTNVIYSGGGPLLPGVTGSILDLTFGGPSPLLDFMTFAGNPILHFDLTALGPGVTNVVCSASLNPNNPSCSIGPGSPFILSPMSTGTALSLSAIGNARDGSGNSNWLGLFTTQFAGLTPAQIQTALLSGGTVTSTYSGSFNITATPAVPEPSSMMLLGTGLVGFAGMVRRKLKR